MSHVVYRECSVTLLPFLSRLLKCPWPALYPFLCVCVGCQILSKTAHNQSKRPGEGWEGWRWRVLEGGWDQTSHQPPESTPISCHPANCPQHSGHKGCSSGCCRLRHLTAQVNLIKQHSGGIDLKYSVTSWWAGIGVLLIMFPQFKNALD